MGSKGLGFDDLQVVELGDADREVRQELAVADLVGDVVLDPQSMIVGRIVSPGSLTNASPVPPDSTKGAIRALEVRLEGEDGPG